MIILARHGQTQWNKIKRLQGWNNSPLTELGKQQAQSVSAEISKLINVQNVTLIASPLGRTVETATIIASALEMNTDIATDPLLKEYSYGAWEGLTYDEIKKYRMLEWQSRQADKWNYIVPKGESYAMVSARAKTWLTNLQTEQATLAVIHEMIGRTIRGAYLGLDKESTMALTQNNNEIIILKDGIETKITAL